MRDRFSALLGQPNVSMPALVAELDALLQVRRADSEPQCQFRYTDVVSEGRLAWPPALVAQLDALLLVRT